MLESNTLTTGTAGKMTGTARLDTVPGNTGTPADEADVRVNVSTTDVRKQSDGTDYAGNLIFRLALRVTDRGTGTSEATLRHGGGHRHLAADQLHDNAWQ